MSALPDLKTFDEIAIELGVSPSFVEKDWHSVQIVRLISEAAFDEITPIFSGGTSLSKGYGLIQRFSEDMDFKVKSASRKTRAERRAFRNAVIDLLRSQKHYSVDEESILSRDSGRFFSCNITYPQSFELDEALRNTGLQLEMRIQDELILEEEREIHSFVTQLSDQPAETRILCVQPIETAADKFSALLWRIRTRDRNQELGHRDNDPTLVRHLHDLCALEPLASDNQIFSELVNSAYEMDKGRRGSNSQMTLGEAIKEAMSVIDQQKTEYEAEYAQFVAAMSYAPNEEQITFEQSLVSFSTLAECT